MADVLTQAQIDEMLKNVAAGAVPEVSAKEEEKVKEYDFRAPKKFTKEQIKVLDGIFENYARLLSSYLTGLLRLYCRVSLVNIEEQRYSEFNNALPDYVLMGMVDMGIKNEEVSETTVIVQISNTIVHDDRPPAGRTRRIPGREPRLHRDRDHDNDRRHEIHGRASIRAVVFPHRA